MLPYLILVFSALAAGAQNSLAGGGTLYTFPALEHFTNPVSANATSTVALLTGSLASAWGFRNELKPSKKWLWWLVPPCIVGGTLGTWLVIHSAKTFETLVPWLILTASLLFLFQPLIARWVGAGQPHEEPPTRVKIGVVFFQFIVGIYGGYFGAGIGILMISSLSLMGLGDIHRVNALKSLLAAFINIMSVAVWILAGSGTVGQLVAWKYVPAMAIAAIVGGYLGARWSRRLNKNLVRWLVIAIGFGLTAYYFAKQFEVI